MQEKYTEKMITYLPVIRQSLKMTQKQLATKLGVSRQTIVVFENRKQTLPWSVYLALVFLFQQYEISKDLLDKLELFSIEFVRDDL